MPRKKRVERYLTLECVLCKCLFDAVREDAKTCSAKCRVAFYRDRKDARKHAKRGTFKLCLTMFCKQCGITFDSIEHYNCPTCGAFECRSATNEEHLAFTGQQKRTSTTTATSATPTMCAN